MYLIANFNKLMNTNMKQFKLVLALAAVLFVTLDGVAQKKRTATKRTATKKATTKKTNTAQNAAPVAAAAPAPAEDSLPIKRKVESFEQDDIIQRLTIKDRTPLAYEHIREDDAIFKQRVWRDIDIREKMNQQFVYEAEESNGSQKFIDILLRAIQEDPNVISYNSIDDRFSTPMTKAELIGTLVGGYRDEQVPDRDKDPDGSKGIFKTVRIRDDFNANAVTKFRIKEDWVFDKESSRLTVRILGIAPIQVDTLTVPGMPIEKLLFWVYYPKLRPMLAKYEAYNGKNFGARPTWEEVLESRMFSSYIVKSTYDNYKNVYLDQIPGLKENGILRLYEGDLIHNRIRDYEQNLWSY
jgi:gliding motility associated protien GldN